ncbi:MAG TPA: radical SAM family heme chaperone HemW [Rhodanobacteraceae bacterium]|jgi:oxygen-independent coproporphyrinogen-3 oxidase|nr:radical SAM family heme chaperone HemW [Rhodanobacteraceae bacterium]
MSMMAPPLSLYVHIPWCVKKCPYCDFNSHAREGALPVDAYIDALLADLDSDLRRFGDAIAGREIVSVFFGGGTPSLFAPDEIARIIDGVAQRLTLRDAIEITLETNPGTVEHGRFDEYRRAGVSRISFGVQSFDDEKLRRLGRIHSAAEAERAIKSAQDAGYDNMNLDLMYALPEQTLDGALSDVQRAIALEPAHISHYQLTLEPNTLFAAKPPPLPDIDTAWDMQDMCQQRLAAAGYVQYEVSAYAREGRRCAHNLNYWAFGDYLGIGAGAHGKISDAASGTVTRTTKVKLPRGYLERAVRADSFGSFDPVAPAQLPFEFMLNALRLNEGTSISEFEERTGVSRDALAGPLAGARERDWIEPDSRLLRPTESGRRFLNDLIGLFLAE